MPTRKNFRKGKGKTMKVSTKSSSKNENYQAYCVKCREKQNMVSAKKVKTKKGRFMMKGICPVCGTKMNRFI